MKAAVFAHFDKHGIVDDYVLYSLRCYRQYFDFIIFISASNLNIEQINRASIYADSVISKENIGYDFMSWRCGFENLPNANYDEITFINDSCYGPCGNISSMFHNATKLDADLWGVSINSQFRPHVQSFMMSFRKRLINSGFAKSFWGSVECTTDKFELIMKYEVGLSEKVENSGFKIGALYSIDPDDHHLKRRTVRDNLSDYDLNYNEEIERNILENRNQNPMQMYWGEAFRRGIPLVKIELFRKNPLKVNIPNIIKTIKRDKWYDIYLIKNHLARTCSQKEIEYLIDHFKY